MDFFKKIMLLATCITILFPCVAIAAPKELHSAQYMANLVRQTDIPIKESLAQFFIETNTQFFVPSDTIYYSYTEKVNGKNRERTKKLGTGDEYSDLAIEYAVDSKHLVDGHECTTLGIYNIDSTYYSSWVLRDEDTAFAVKNVILPYMKKLLDYLGNQAPDIIQLNFSFDKDGNKFPQIELWAYTSDLRDYYSGKLTLKQLIGKKASLSYKLEGKRHVIINNIKE